MTEIDPQSSEALTKTPLVQQQGTEGATTGSSADEITARGEGVNPAGVDASTLASQEGHQAVEQAAEDK